MDEAKGTDDDVFEQFLRGMKTALKCDSNVSWSRKLESMGDTCLLCVLVEQGGGFSRPALRVMFYRPGTPHSSLWSLYITADKLAEHRESLLMETSISNFVLLMVGALHGNTAEFRLTPRGDTIMALKYIPDGSSTKLNGCFTLPLVSDGVPSEVSDMLFSMPTSKLLDEKDHLHQEIEQLKEKLAKAKAGGGGSGAGFAGAGADLTSEAKPVKKARGRRPVKRRRKGKGVKLG